MAFSKSLSLKSFLRIDSFLLDIPPLSNQLGFFWGWGQGWGAVDDKKLTVFETNRFFSHYSISEDKSLLVFSNSIIRFRVNVSVSVSIFLSQSYIPHGTLAFKVE